MGSLPERLETREAAARTRVEALRVEMDRLAERLAAEQELLGRLEITRRTVIEVLAGDEPVGFRNPNVMPQGRSTRAPNPRDDPAAERDQ